MSFSHARKFLYGFWGQYVEVSERCQVSEKEALAAVLYNEMQG